MTLDDFIPPFPIHPGDYIKDQLEMLNWSVQDLANKSGISSAVFYDIIDNRKDITIEVAEKLERVLGFKTETLLKLQSKYHRDKEILKRRN